MPLSHNHHTDDKPYTDFIQPFLIDHSAIRGRLVRLDEVLNTILSAHDYPMAVSIHLAEQIVLASLLSATLTGEGILTVQTKGDGPVSYMVVDVMANGVIRGYAKVDDAALKAALKGSRAKSHPLSKIMGTGHLAITLDPDGDAERYQGIVELKGKSLSETFKGYFAQSQQAEIAVEVVITPPGKTQKHWHAGGMIIERMPLEGGTEEDFTPEEQDEIWKRTKLFMSTIKKEEMLDSSVTPQNLLYRLFSEDGVWVYKLQALNAGCRCSRERVERVLSSLPREELAEMLNNNEITIHCQFCNTRQVFTHEQLESLNTDSTKELRN